MFDLGLGRIKRYAEKSLLTDLAIEKCDTPFSHNGVTYWCILLLIGKGNLLTRILCRGKTKLELTADVSFKSFETEPSIAGEVGASFKGDTYEVEQGWARRRMPFRIESNSKIKLAVARGVSSKKWGYHLYPIGGWASNFPLTETYDLILNLEIEDEDKPVKLRSNTIREYIKEGNPN